MASGLDASRQDDERGHLRLHYNADVELETSDGKFYPGRLRDIGLDSLYAFIDGGGGEYPAIGETVKVKVTMVRSKSRLTLDMEAKIVRRDEAGLAMRFDQFLKWWPIFVMFPHMEN